MQWSEVGGKGVGQHSANVTIISTQQNLFPEHARKYPRIQTGMFDSTSHNKNLG